MNKLNYKLDPQIQKKYDVIRFNILNKFMDSIEQPVLDLGEPNFFGRKLKNHFGFKEIYNTSGNLDLWDEIESVKINPIKFKTIWFFELIEHLKNPDLVLRKLKFYSDKKTRLFITYPYRYFRIFWSPTHYHEMDRLRFKNLVEDAGFIIVKEYHKILWREWNYYLKGIRPILRLLFGWYFHNYYELRLK